MFYFCCEVLSFIPGFRFRTVGDQLQVFALPSTYRWTAFGGYGSNMMKISPMNAWPVFAVGSNVTSPADIRCRGDYNVIVSKTNTNTAVSAPMVDQYAISNACSEISTVLFSAISLFEELVVH
jgi:hypothetical protein